ncbi:hypothetical protein CSB37_01625 [bacterium DOLZORAL124_38_8]|nr:MAG: hypothetical protein CSB37_01625 [bacterium DOLZORAL124_38_8]
MKLSINKKILKTASIFVFINDKKWNKSAYADLLPANILNDIAEKIKNKHFEGKEKELLQIFPANETRNVFLVGTGNQDTKLDFRKVIGSAIRHAQNKKLTTLAFVLGKNMCAKCTTIASLLANYQFSRQTKHETVSIEAVQIVAQTDLKTSDVSEEIFLAESVNKTRDLVNAKANEITPEAFVAKAKELGKGLRNPLKVRVFDYKKLEKLKYGGILGVSQGSSTKPAMVVFEYFGGKKDEAPQALVGKGVCFDSGGYNLKPTGSIETMHCDMAGAANVFGVFNWIKETKPKINVVGVVGLVENMVSGTSYHPGDIITMANEQTCLITNTDAEGRLVLADCLHHAVETYKPARIMDFATLTGACIRALGDHITGLVTNDHKFLSEIKKSADVAQESVWELPLNKFFRSKIKDEVADLQNWTAGVNAGASMAGAFLENFVDSTPWVHFDIAGTAYHEKQGNELHPVGATGAIVPTVIEYLKQKS